MRHMTNAWLFYLSLFFSLLGVNVLKMSVLSVHNAYRRSLVRATTSVQPIYPRLLRCVFDFHVWITSNGEFAIHAFCFSLLSCSTHFSYVGIPLPRWAQVTSFIAGLFCTNQASCALVIAPKSVIRGWETELRRWLVKAACPRADVRVFFVLPIILYYNRAQQHVLKLPNTWYILFFILVT